jgi:hypothetical protein
MYELFDVSFFCSTLQSETDFLVIKIKSWGILRSQSTISSGTVKRLLVSCAFAGRQEGAI